MANSIIGFHTSIGGTKDGVGDWIANANSKGIPVGLKGVDDAGLCFEGQQTGQAHGVSNWLVYRVSTAGQANGIEYDVPNYLKSPKDAAQEHFDKTAAKWPPELDRAVVWSEPINEPRGKYTGEPMWNNLHPVDWLGYFMYEYAVITNAAGFKVCGPSFNSGEPGDEDSDGNPLPLSDVVRQYSRPGMLKYLAYCAANPGKAALSTHDYVWRFEPPQYPALWGRWEAAIAAADNAGIPRTFPIFVTEFGFAPDYAPSYPAVIPDLDIYNLICARFPQVKFAAAWTLQSGYDPVDDRVITWIGYPIDSTFNAGPQPAETHLLFGGTLPGGTPPMTDNLLQNPSFEDGWENQNGGHRPKLWRLDWKLEDGYVLGESQVKPQDQIPPEERPLFFVPPDETSWFMLKVFKNNAPIRPKLYTAPEQFPNLPAGKYRYSFHIYPDVYVSATGSQKIWSDNPSDCRLRLYWNGVRGAWQSLHPYGGNAPKLITFEWEHTGGPAQIGFQCDMPNLANANNGFMTDAHDLRLVEEPTMTWQEQAWNYAKSKKKIAFNRTSALQVAISADGFNLATDQLDFPPAPAAPEKKIAYAVDLNTGEWRVYWVDIPAPGQPWGVAKWFGDPAVSPPAPFEFAAYPVQGRPYTITSPFNAPRSYGLHEGIDLSAPMGNPILAVADGVVEYVRAEDTSGYGLYVRVKHSDRFKTWYAHLQAVSVTVGQVVTAGQQLGLADSTGNSTGSHLHLTVQDLEQGLDGYVVAKVVNPKPFLDALVSLPVPGIDLRRFMIADPAAFRVVRMPDGRQEEIQDMQLGGGLFVRRKNDLGEWWKVDSQYFYLVHDTSPDTGGAGIERVYTLAKGGLLGAPKNPLFMNVGQSWQETGTHYVQFRAKNGCGLLAENSGFAQNTAVLVDRQTNYTFNTYGQNLTLDEVIFLKTGVEEQIYGRHNGKAVGWCGWKAPWGSSEIVELYWNRPPLAEEPNRYCSW